MYKYIYIYINHEAFTVQTVLKHNSVIRESISVRLIFSHSNLSNRLAPVTMFISVCGHLLLVTQKSYVLFSRYDSK